MSERTDLRSRVAGWLKARDLELVGAVLLLGLLLLAFIQVADEVLEGPLSVDDRILVALRDPHDLAVGLGGSTVESMVRDVTALGSGTVTGLLTLALVGYLFLTRRPGAAVLVLVAVAGSAFLNEALKELFDRARPTIVPHLVRVDQPSFPSGHTMISATVYPTVAVLFGRLVTRRRARYYLMAIGIGLAVLVGASRVYLGVHYPTDVLGGLCMGLSWALVCGIVARVLQRRRVFATGSRDERLDPERGDGPSTQEPAGRSVHEL